MTVFQDCLRQQLLDHPSMLPRDVVKLCYQAACGAEHLLGDLNGAKAYFAEEFASVPERDEPLYEWISEEVCRVNLGAWKRTGMSSEWLFRMFTGTVFQADGKQRLTEYLDAAEEVLRGVDFDMDAWRIYLTDYKKQGMPAVRHTEQYREAEQPAYRIVGTQYLKLLPVLQKIAANDCGKRPYVIAIDGKAGAGKSTVASLLQKVLDAGMVYMDDFFLPPNMRSEERLTEAGGNIHYERFAEKVIPYLRDEAFSYDVFDCSCMDYNGTQTVADCAYRIVEGSYSHHPKFGNYMDLRVFVDIDSKEQLRRIVNRNGEALGKRFQNEWIPMENQYFDTFQIRGKADVVLYNR